MMGGFIEIWLAYVVLWIWLRVLVAKRPTWVWLSRFPYIMGGSAALAFLLGLSATASQFGGAGPDDVQQTFATLAIARALAWLVAIGSLGANLYWTYAHTTEGAETPDRMR